MGQKNSVVRQWAKRETRPARGQGLAIPPCQPGWPTVPSTTWITSSMPLVSVEQSRRIPRRHQFQGSQKV